MSKFKVGDKVKLLDKNTFNKNIDIGCVYTIKCYNYMNSDYPIEIKEGDTLLKEEWLELVESINSNEVCCASENKTTKIMSVIKKAFQSKESKAVVDLGLGENSHNLNNSGLMEFVSFMFEINVELRDSFLAKLVEVNNEKNK